MPAAAAQIDRWPTMTSGHRTCRKELKYSAKIQSTNPEVVRTSNYPILLRESETHAAIGLSTF
jgi:hypothetical protein